MKLDELTEASYHGKDEKLEKLLDTVARVMPFVGYESMGAETLKDELNAAFMGITGIEWYEWKDRK